MCFDQLAVVFPGRKLAAMVTTHDLAAINSQLEPSLSTSNKPKLYGSLRHPCPNSPILHANSLILHSSLATHSNCYAPQAYLSVSRLRFQSAYYMCTTGS